MHTVIAVDVGNTWVHFVEFRHDREVSRQRICTRTATMRQLTRQLSLYHGAHIVVCSVVPKVTALFMRIKRSRAFKKSVLIVGKDVQVPIVSLYNKKNIGMDRLVAGFAARSLYPGSRFVIDFGTATTFDVLSREGAYMGGFILPGVGSTLRVFSECALLPKKIILTPRASARGSCRIPRDTQESIQRGLLEGFTLLVNAFVNKYSNALSVSSRVPVVITGGDAVHFLKDLDFPHVYEPLLVAKGLCVLARKPSLF